MSIEFKAWPKIPRLFRSCIITEKIDGTNAAVGIVRLDQVPNDSDTLYAGIDAILSAHPQVIKAVQHQGIDYAVYAQSRKRLITPDNDNAGFARWTQVNAGELVAMLGEGLHFGEWWGQGIARTYGMSEKHFSLFNVVRYADADVSLVPNVHLVPELYRGPFSTNHVRNEIARMKVYGSVAARGFMFPEGVITFHVASGEVFKTTIEDDEKPKGSNE